MDLMKQITEKAKSMSRKLVFPEGTEERTIKAAKILRDEKIVIPVLIGDNSKIQEKAREIDVDLTGIDIADPKTSSYMEDFSREFYNLRKHKGLTYEQAQEQMRDPLYFGAMMLRKGYASGSIAGAENATGNVIRPAIQVVGLKEGIKVVSSMFIMITTDGRIFGFADSAVVPDPDKDQLASIAMATAQTYQLLTDIEPVVAMLSFSTKGSAKHPRADKVIEATEIVKKTMPELKVDGELQVDAAIVPAVGEKKAPGSDVAGKANVLIFPDLDSANIGYKLVQRFAGAQAIGPFLQGLNKPANDLSRGCSVDDIVKVAATTAILAG